MTSAWRAKGGAGCPCRPRTSLSPGAWDRSRHLLPPLLLLLLPLPPPPPQGMTEGLLEQGTSRSVRGTCSTQAWTHAHTNSHITHGHAQMHGHTHAHGTCGHALTHTCGDTSTHAYTHTYSHVLPHHNHLKQSGAITTPSQMVKEIQVRIRLAQGHPAWRYEGHRDIKDTGGNTEKGEATGTLTSLGRSQLE